MLMRLILIGLAAGGVFFAVQWLRSLRSQGTLTAWEIADLTKRAESSERLKAALAIRIGIVEASPAERKVTFARKADDALRRLSQQESIQDKIRKTLAEEDPLDLENQIANTQVEIESLKGDARMAKETHLAALETHLDQLRNLRRRLTDLEEHGHRLVMEMKNLHLALLEASSTESTLEGGKLESSLDRLEAASEEVRREAQSEAEVDRLLAASTQRQRNTN